MKRAGLETVASQRMSARGLQQQRAFQFVTTSGMHTEVAVHVLRDDGGSHDVATLTLLEQGDGELMVLGESGPDGDAIDAVRDIRNQVER